MVSVKRFGIALMVASLLAPSALTARQNIVRNGSLELGPGQGGPNPFIAADWIEFGENVERSREANRTSGGEAALKAFGDSQNPAAGGLQEIDSTPGDVVEVHGWLYTRNMDKLTGSAEAGVRVEFLGLFGSILDTYELFVIDPDSPGDTWIEASIGPVTAPTGTLAVRVVCLLEYTIGAVGGSVFWDDVTVTGASGGAILNGDFETAGVSTEPNPNGIDEWFGFNDQQKSDESAYHGDSSVKFGAEEAFSGLVQEMGELNDGDRIFLVARALIPSSDPLDGNARVGIKLEFDPIVDVPPPEENLSFDEDVTTNAWMPVGLSTTVPEGATQARIVCIYVGDTTTTGSVHFDTAEARRNGGSNQLLNASFEEGDGGFQGIDFWTEFNSEGVSSAQKSCFLPTVTPVDGFCTMRATGEAVAGIFQEIDVVPGETLDVSAMLLSPSGDALSGTGVAGVKIEWASGSVPDDVDIFPGGPNTIDAGDPEDVWHVLTIDYTMPAGTSALATFTNIISKGSATTGSVYIDGCEAVVLNRFDGADVDGDDDADLFEFGVFQECFVVDPPPNGVLGWPCYVFDHDDNEVIDMADFEFYANRITGP